VALVKAGLARGAAASLALHAAGLALVLKATLRSSPPPETVVVEIVWEAAPEPSAKAPEPVDASSTQEKFANPKPEPAELQPAETEPPLAEVAPPPAPSPEPPPRPATKPLRPAAEPIVRNAAPRPSEAPTTPPHSAPPASAASTGPAAEAPAQDDYARALLRWLEPHRRYPRAARLRGIEGTVRLSLTIDRAGSVLAAAIAESSGERLLDREALEMVERAAPAPPLPADWAPPQATFILPIRFALSR
jgi:protein TonB